MEWAEPRTGPAEWAGPVETKAVQVVEGGSAEGAIGTCPHAPRFVGAVRSPDEGAGEVADVGPGGTGDDETVHGGEGGVRIMGGQGRGRIDACLP